MFTVLTSLDPTKAMGIDSIGPHILNKCAHALYHHLFSLSLLKHHIPEEWRIHRISPIFKLDDRSAVKTHLFALLRCLDELCKTIILLHDFISKAILPKQFGFLSKRSIGNNC